MTFKFTTGWLVAL